jgi:hypothetical protein
VRAEPVIKVAVWITAPSEQQDVIARPLMTHLEQVPRVKLLGNPKDAKDTDFVVHVRVKVIDSEDGPQRRYSVAALVNPTRGSYSFLHEIGTLAELDSLWETIAEKVRPKADDSGNAQKR